MDGVVAIVSITLCEVAPGVIGADGVKEAVGPAGDTVAVNLMGLENVPLEGVTVRLKTPDCPAFTVSEEVEGVTV